MNLNLGLGRGTSVLELLETFQKVNNIDIPYLYTCRRKGDFARAVANNSLAIARLNWAPKKTLEDMCRDGWLWQVNNPQGF